jgi:hypothetical protein
MAERGRRANPCTGKPSMLFFGGSEIRGSRQTVRHGGFFESRECNAWNTRAHLGATANHAGASRYKAVAGLLSLRGIFSTTKNTHWECNTRSPQYSRKGSVLG